MSSNKDKVNRNAVLSGFPAMTTSLLIILALILAGCGGDKTGESQASADEEKSETPESDQGNGSENDESSEEDEDDEDDESSEETATNPLGDLLGVVKELPIESINPDDVVAGGLDAITGIVGTVGDGIRDVAALTDEEEMDFGEYLHEQFMKDAKVVKDRKAHGRLQKLAQPLFAMLERKNIQYTFTILKDDETVNAFACPGGYIYVLTGMLNFVENDVELQSLLGHEIGHVDLKHCADYFAPIIRKNQVAGEIPIAVMHDIIGEINHHFDLQFSEEDEFEADKYGYTRVRKLGHSKEAALSLSRRMIDYQKAHGITTDKKEAENVTERLNQVFINHFETHPPSEERLKRLEELKVEGIDE